MHFLKLLLVPAASAYSIQKILAPGMDLELESRPMARVHDTASSPAIVKPFEEIPGDSPIELCEEDEPQLLDIESIVIEPNPPVPGQNLTITAAGTLKTDIVDGAYVDVLVRYGFITLVNRRYDLCELMPEVNLECPLKKGFLKLTRDVELPEEVPPGEYYVDAKAYTPDDRLLTCLSAVVDMEA